MIRRKSIKIALGLLVFITLPSLLFFGFIYFKYQADLPIGAQGEKAELLAAKMLEALDYKAFQETKYIEWT